MNFYQFLNVLTIGCIVGIVLIVLMLIVANRNPKRENNLFADGYNYAINECKRVGKEDAIRIMRSYVDMARMHGDFNNFDRGIEAFLDDHDHG